MTSPLKECYCIDEMLRIYQGGRLGIHKLGFISKDPWIVINCSLEAGIPVEYKHLGISKYYDIGIPESHHINIVLYAKVIYDIVKECIENSKPVFIHCSRGSNRSPAIVVYILMRTSCLLIKKGMATNVEYTQHPLSFDDAYNTVCKYNPDVSIYNTYLKQLSLWDRNYTNIMSHSIL